MYNGQVLGTATTGAGVAVLPSTGGSTLGQILALSAIGIGVAALVSQIVVRLVRARSR